ncbi:MAG: hypothetical protein HPY90_10205 [Syntrophothermus sp.]|uniref:hypothetical protein n=1 Tax=Syntrophothermus sp. TaxID=2736299 RepID=UPI00257B48F5|nr:hypothetical protein [Syntrophothermus sp.]NSW83624.1 hypothetical protein [Syntrophothermus sp.]
MVVRLKTRADHMEDIAELLVMAQARLNRIIRDEIAAGLASPEIVEKYTPEISHVPETNTLRIFIEACPPKASVGPKTKAYKEVRSLYYMLIQDALKKGFDSGVIPRSRRPLYAGPVVIFIRYHFSDRVNKDVDNFDAKPLIDVLRHSGIIQEDNYKYAKLILAGTNSTKTGTEVIISDEDTFFAKCWNFNTENLHR